MPLFLDCGLAAIKVAVGISSADAYVIASHMDLAPAPREIFAVLDTGASISCIDLDVLACLRSEPVDQIPILNIGTESSCPIHYVSIKVLNRKGETIFQEPDFRVAGVNLKNRDYGALLGIDVLGAFTLAFLKAANRIEMSQTFQSGDGI